MFKIVETIEKGRKELTIIPSAWEMHGQLYWPKTRADKQVRVPESIPDEEGWFRMPCKLKRNYLINYEVAEEELQRMLENDETDHEQPAAEVMKKRVRVSLPKQTSTYDDFNSLAKSCVSSQQVLNIPTITTASKSPQENDEFYQFSNISGLTSFEETNPAQNSVLFISNAETNNNNEPVYQSTGDFQSILMNQLTIIENQKFLTQKINENQFAVMQQLAKVEAMIDKIASNSILSQKCACNKTADTRSIINEDIVNVLEPINSLEKLIELEEALKDKNLMGDLMNKLSYICGNRGGGNGINNCYVLIDRIFSRKFMTLCSWAGGSRGKNEKIPFKIYKNTINLFFAVIKLSDADFTYQNCEEFLKNVIRNSTRRNESNMVRSSCLKRRPTHLCYKVQENCQRECEEEGQETPEHNNKRRKGDEKNEENEG